MFQLLQGGYNWQLHPLKYFLTAIVVFFHTCVCQLIYPSFGTLWVSSIVHLGLYFFIYFHLRLLYFLCEFDFKFYLFMLPAWFYPLISMFYFHSHYEDYLSASFPFGSYKQVFIAPEMAISSLTLGASMSIFSSQILFDEKVIDQVCLFTQLI